MSSIGTARRDPCMIRGPGPPATMGATDRHSSSITPASASWGVERRPALGQHDPGAAAVELGEDRLRPGSVRRQSHGLGDRLEPGGCLGRSVAAGEDQRTVLAGALIGEQRQVEVEVQAGADHGQPGLVGASSGAPCPSGGRSRPGQAAAVGPHRAGRDYDPVRAGPHRREHGLVGRVAECSTGSVDRGSPVGGGDHVEHQPRPSFRPGSGKSRVELHRIDLGDRARHQSSHVASIGARRCSLAAPGALGIIGGRPTWACQTDSGRQPQRLRCLGSSGVDRPGRARPIPVGSRSDSAVWDHRGSTDLGVPDRFRSAAAATPLFGIIGGRPTWACQTDSGRQPQRLRRLGASGVDRPGARPGIGGRRHAAGSCKCAGSQRGGRPARVSAAVLLSVGSGRLDGRCPCSQEIQRRCR